ncbi:MAG: hypothetical protein KC731_09225, partial [Myxococcales bacterium]|nr:hypothetical protein [Myxococcales bacterium]
MKAAFFRGWGLLLVVGGFVGACAASPDVGTGGGSPNSSSSSSSGSGAGDVGGGASGGSGAGGEDLCAMDCSTIVPPDCHQAVCNDGSYPGVVGACVVVPAANGTSCDDGQFCTTADTCQNGSCVGGPQNDCGMAPPECTAITCDETTDSCGTTPLQNGDPCTPSDLCLVGATCVNGLCAGGTPNDCFFQPVPNECYESVCNPQNGICEPVVGNEGEPCVDLTTPCLVGKTCTSGMCGGGTPKDCSQLTQGCVLGVCDANQGGMCVAQAVGQGMACDDLDSCTVGEICDMGTCGMGTPITACVDNDACCAPGCDETNDSDCAKEEYSQSFPQGTVSQTSQQCVDWQTFSAQLTGAFTAVTIRGSQDPVGVTCNVPSMATQLCNALNTKTVVSGLNCNGRVWNVGDCGPTVGYEINSRTTSGDCSCDTSYTVRPCINNLNWG